MSEEYNPWTVVRCVFDHLSAHGLHPVLGETGDPSEPAAALLRALGITPGQPALGDGHLARAVRDDLAALRAQYDPVEPGDGGRGSTPVGEPSSTAGRGET